jgi:gluconate kinase|tara:strand:- start:782 stop:1078 length:297 start_codon:yes stop_codon:yes gene_type:complete
MKLIAGIKVHPNALAVSKDKPLNISDVKDWLEYNDNMRKKYSTLARKKEKGALARSLIHEGYIREIRHYLRNGDWISDFFGRDQEFMTPKRVLVERGY